MSATELNNLLHRAEILSKTNWLHAFHILDQAQETYPDESRIFEIRGEIFFHQQRYKEAVKALQKALELSPGNSHISYMLANSYFSQGEYRLALVYYDQVNPPTMEIIYNRALTMAYLGRNDESCKLLMNTIHSYQPNPYFYTLLIEQLMRLLKYHEAADFVKEAEKKLPPFGNIQLLKAIIYYKLENWLHSYNAFKVTDKLITIFFPDHLNQYANAAARVGMVDVAIEIFERSLGISQYQMPVYEDYVKVLIQEERYLQAQKVLRRVKANFSQLTPLLKLMQERVNSHFSE